MKTLPDIADAPDTGSLYGQTRGQTAIAAFKESFPKSEHLDAFLTLAKAVHFRYFQWGLHDFQHMNQRQIPSATLELFFDAWTKHLVLNNLLEEYPPILYSFSVFSPIGKLYDF